MTELIAKEDRETVCVYEEASDSWTVESSVRKHITKMLKMYGEENLDKDLCIQDQDGRYIKVGFRGLSFEQVSFRNKSKPREMTEEQRQEAAERLKRARENK